VYYGWQTDISVLTPNTVDIKLIVNTCGPCTLVWHSPLRKCLALCNTQLGYLWSLNIQTHPFMWPYDLHALWPQVPTAQ